jgi:hypothetical protein
MSDGPLTATFLGRATANRDGLGRGAGCQAAFSTDEDWICVEQLLLLGDLERRLREQPATRRQTLKDDDSGGPGHGPAVTSIARVDRRASRTEHPPTAWEMLIALDRLRAAVGGSGSGSGFHRLGGHAVARACGAETPFIRPAAWPEARSPRWQWCGTRFTKSSGTDKRYEVVIDLDVTAPLRHVSDVENAFNLLITGGPLTVFSVKCSEESLLQRCWGRLRGFVRREGVR